MVGVPPCISNLLERIVAGRVPDTGSFDFKQSQTTKMGARWRGLGAALSKVRAQKKDMDTERCKYSQNALHGGRPGGEGLDPSQFVT